MKMTSTKTLASLVAAIAMTAGPAISSAASVATRWNPVSDNAIDTSSGNNDRSDWDGLIAYPVDPDELLNTDIHTITIAHDSTTLYVRQVMNRTDSSGFLSPNQYVMFDTDQSRSTGYRGANDTFAVGADYMLQGASLYQYTGGDGTTWGWDFIAATTHDDFPHNDHEFSILLTDLGITGTPLFDFLSLHTDASLPPLDGDALFGGGDAYPDDGQSGASGDYFTYGVPEPSVALLGLFGLVAWCRRRR